MPDLSCEVQDLLLEVVDFKQEVPAGADLGGVTKVTSHPPGAAVYISCYYYACELSYSDVVLCPSSSQILATPLHP